MFSNKVTFVILRVRHICYNMYSNIKILSFMAAKSVDQRLNLQFLKLISHMLPFHPKYSAVLVCTTELRIARNEFVDH